MNSKDLHTTVNRGARGPNKSVKEKFSLRIYGPKTLLKITHCPDPRPMRGRGGKVLPNAPRTLQELEEKHQLIYCYLEKRQVQPQDIQFHNNPLFNEQAIYVFVPDDQNCIERVRWFVNDLGFTCCRQQVPMFPPRDLEIAV